MIPAVLIGLVAVALYTWAVGIHPCQDGDRYLSGERQPTPFNRRFTRWNPFVLMFASWASVVAICAMLGTWQRALMFAALPGAATMAFWPMTVDGPAMALALAAATLFHAHPVAGIIAALASGTVHERGPVFAALYAWSPWLLLGLLGVQWWSRPAAPNHASPELADRLVGHSTLGAIRAHKPHVDLLGDGGLIWALRGIVPLAAWLGAPVQAWLALGLAYASRLVATDTARALVWAAPALLMRLDPPAWAVAIHCMTFRRVLR